MCSPTMNNYLQTEFSLCFCCQPCYTALLIKYSTRNSYSSCCRCKNMEDYNYRKETIHTTVSAEKKPCMVPIKNLHLAHPEKWWVHTAVCQKLFHTKKFRPSWIFMEFGADLDSTKNFLKPKFGWFYWSPFKIWPLKLYFKLSL